MTALGMIETKGLIGAIEGADAMLKAADVCLLEKNLASGGLVTITIAGEVAAVRAAVDAAVASIQRLAGASLVSSHVIARPDAEVARVVRLQAQQAETAKKRPAASQTAAKASASAQDNDTAARSNEVPYRIERAEVVAQETPPQLIRHSMAQLKKMGVNRLRQIAQGLEGIALSRDEITSAGKNALIDSILHVYRQIDDEE